MPQPIWPSPVTPIGDVGYAEPAAREPRGLFDFMGQDFGNEIGPRLGVISQILMGLGSGRGPGNVAEQLGQIEERSAARRERRKAERMVRRAADKIRARDPELADAMEANTAFGMEMLGKKYSQKWETEAAIERDKALLPGRIELEKETAIARGDVERANKLVELQEKAKLDRQAGQDLITMLTGKQGATGVATNGEQPAPVTPPATGQTMAPVSAVSSDGAVQAPVSAPQTMPTATDQSSQVPISTDGPTADLQTTMMRRFPGIKVYPVEAAAILTESRQGSKAEVHTMLRALQSRRDAELKTQQEQDFQREQETTAHQRKIDEPNVLETAYQAGVPTLREPRIGSFAELDKLAVLRKEGYSDQEIEMLGGADPLYNQIIAGVRGGPSAEAAAASDLRGDLATAQKAKAEAGITTTSAEGIIQSATAMRNTIPQGPDATPQDLRDLEIIDTAIALAPKDPTNATKTLVDLQAEQRLRGEATSQAAARKVTSDVNLSQEARQVKEAEAKDKTAQEAKKATHIAAVNQAANTKRGIKKIVKMVYDIRSTEPMFGIGGALASGVPGSLRRQVEALGQQIEDQVAFGGLAALKEASPSGASGFGALTAPELQLLRTKYNNLSAAMERGENFDEALKEVWNAYENIINPVGGKRLDLKAPGFKYRDFDFQVDNPGLYDWAMDNKQYDIIRQATEAKRRGQDSSRREIAPGIFIENAPVE